MPYQLLALYTYNVTGHRTRLCERMRKSGTSVTNDTPCLMQQTKGRIGYIERKDWMPVGKKKKGKPRISGPQ